TWHQPTATSPSKASSPGGGPRFTIFRNATLFVRAGLCRYAAPILQYMHQHRLHTRLSLNKSTTAGQRSGVSGRTVSFIPSRPYRLSSLQNLLSDVVFGLVTLCSWRF